MYPTVLHTPITRLCLTDCAFAVVSRSIWTSAPEFLWYPEAGRSPALRARHPSLSTQPATTARPASPCCSTTKSSWRVRSPSELKGYEDPTMCAWGHKVPAIFYRPFTATMTTIRHPGFSSITPCQQPITQKEQHRLEGFSPSLSFLLPTNYREDSRTPLLSNELLQHPGVGGTLNCY